MMQPHKAMGFYDDFGRHPWEENALIFARQLCVCLGNLFVFVLWLGRDVKRNFIRNYVLISAATDFRRQWFVMCIYPYSWLSQGYKEGLLSFDEGVCVRKNNSILLNSAKKALLR